MPEYNPRRGREVIEEAAEKRGGDFTPFCPEIRWKDGDKRAVLILTPPDEVVEALVHEYVKVGTFKTKGGEVKPKYEFFLSRKDRGIGERYDELEDRLGNSPRLRIMGVGVELVPIAETDANNRQKVVGFEVATSTYNRKGEDDETIEVTQPNIGIISLASQNFWKPLMPFDDKAPLTEIPFEITRQGNDANTSYSFFPFIDQPVDFGNLLDYIDGVTYLAHNEDEFTELVGELEAAATDLDAAQAIAEALLMARLNELADSERYDKFVKPIEELEQRFGKKKTAAKPDRAARPARSTRRSRTTAPAEEAPAAAEPEATAATAAPEAPPAEPAEAAPAEKKAAKGDRFAALRDRAAKAQQAAA